MALDYSKIIEQESEKEFYKKTHKNIMEYIQIHQPVTFWQIVRNVQGSDRRVLRLLHQLTLNGSLRKDRKKISLSHRFKRKDFKEEVCTKCQGKIIPIEGKFHQVLKELHKIILTKPIPTFLFDQRPVTPITSVRRVAYLLWRGDLEGKNIAVIGDDDLTSLAIGLLGKAKSIVVFDIDIRLVKFINSVAKRKNLKLKAHTKDLTKGIPKEFYAKFDVFLADPTPSPKPFELFTSIGLALLKSGSERIGYLSFFPSHQEKSMEFQNILNKRKVIITDMIPKFTEYDFLPSTYNTNDLALLQKFDSGDERLSFHENLTRFETTKNTQRKIFKVNLQQMLGKATKRVMKNPEKDPAYNSEDRKFILSTMKKMKFKS